MNFVEAPNLPRLGDVAGLGAIDAGKNAITFPMLRILADGDINAIFIKHRSCIDLTRTFGIGISELLSVGRVAIVFPDRLEKCTLAFLYRLWIERIAKPIAAAEQDLFLAIDHRQRGRTPLSVKNVRADFGIVFTQELARLRVEGNKTRRVGRWNI